MRIIVDRSAMESSNLVVGANEPGFHYLNFNADRDLEGIDYTVADIATVREGDPAPGSGEPMQMLRGIEVGNIFQLGMKYSESMGCTYLDKDGKSHPMIMGCYGIGVGRAIASVIEYSHDDYGPVWPMSIAPYQVEICAVDPQKSGVGEAAEKLAAELESLGVEVLYDDRGEKAGSMFSDADLLGIPLRLVVSPKTLGSGEVEFRTRACRDSERLDIASAAGFIAAKVKEELAKFSF